MVRSTYVKQILVWRPLHPPSVSLLHSPRPVRPSPPLTTKWWRSPWTSPLAPINVTAVTEERTCFCAPLVERYVFGDVWHYWWLKNLDRFRIVRRNAKGRTGQNIRKLAVRLVFYLRTCVFRSVLKSCGRANRQAWFEHFLPFSRCSCGDGSYEQCKTDPSSSLAQGFEQCQSGNKTIRIARRFRSQITRSWRRNASKGDKGPEFNGVVAFRDDHQGIVEDEEKNNKGRLRSSNLFGDLHGACIWDVYVSCWGRSKAQTVLPDVWVIEDPATLEDPVLNADSINGGSSGYWRNEWS